MNPLFALRNSISRIEHDYKNGQKITEFYIGGTTVITRWEFSPNIFTGITRPTMYAVLYVPLADYTYTEYRDTIYIVDYNLSAIFYTLMLRLWMQSCVVMDENC